MLESLRGYVPIRKIATVLVGGGLSWLALQLGVDLGDEALNHLAPLVAGGLLGYLVTDPRVKDAISVLDPSDDKA